MELKKSAQYLGELEHFAECIRSGKPVSPSGEDARKVAEVVSAAYLSGTTGRRVSLPLREAVDTESAFKELRSRRVHA
jgi:predicted dehydrogenase